MSKDYAKITDMSARFDDWHTREGNRGFDNTDKALAWEARMWELKFQLAIAQQLSIVAAHLGKIVRKVEE